MRINAIRHIRAAGLLLAIITVVMALAFHCSQSRAYAEESWLWPVPETSGISRGYSGGHDGQDILAYQGAAIVAARSGVVYKVVNGDGDRNWQGYGNGVVIDHGDGLYSHYAHMESVCVAEGSSVSRGQQIGTMGSTGNSTGTHLHFAIAYSPYGGGSRINNNQDAIAYSNDYQSRKPADLGDDFYGYLIMSAPWKHLTVSGQNVVLSDRNDNFDRSQIWHFIKQADGSYKICNLMWEGTEGTSWCLNCDYAGTGNGTNICIWKDNGDAAQRWFLYESGSAYAFVPAHAQSMCMDAAGGSAANGTNIQLYGSNGTTAQVFTPYYLTDETKAALNGSGKGSDPKAKAEVKTKKSSVKKKASAKKEKATSSKEAKKSSGRSKKVIVIRWDNIMKLFPAF